MNWLDGLIEAVGDKVPKDFYTAAQIADIKGMSKTVVLGSLRKAIKSGKIVMRKYRIPGNPYPVQHYGPK